MNTATRPGVKIVRHAVNCPGDRSLGTILKTLSDLSRDLGDSFNVCAAQSCPRILGTGRGQVGDRSASPPTNCPGDSACTSTRNPGTGGNSTSKGPKKDTKWKAQTDETSTDEHDRPDESATTAEVRRLIDKPRSNSWDGAVWSDLRVSREELLVTVTCAKHKDAESGCTHKFEAKPHTVSVEAMPEATDKQRTTLVLVQSYSSFGRDELIGTSLQAAQEVVNLLVTHALSGGLTTKQVAAFSNGSISEPTAYRALKALVKAGRVTNVGSQKRPSYRLAEDGVAST